MGLARQGDAGYDGVDAALDCDEAQEARIPFLNEILPILEGLKKMWRNIIALICLLQSASGLATETPITDIIGQLRNPTLGFRIKNIYGHPWSKLASRDWHNIIQYFENGDPAALDCSDGHRQLFEHIPNEQLLLRNRERMSSYILSKEVGSADWTQDDWERHGHVVFGLLVNEQDDILNEYGYSDVLDGSHLGQFDGFHLTQNISCIPLALGHVLHFPFRGQGHLRNQPSSVVNLAGRKRHDELPERNTDHTIRKRLVVFQGGERIGTLL